ncbi:MAG: prolyl oligopeptidase family serine peptidase [Proteobacteria bacterium]|nr:prolyl oligopeptidase family serine peptidase [Pseudomonadota bacterium]
MPTGRAIAKIVAFHGVGSRGDDLDGLGAAWKAAVPGLEFAAPDGPHAFDAGGAGFQWFSVRGITDENRPARIEAARAGFDATLAHALGSIGAKPDASDAAFVGFSQGAIMSLDAVASGRWRPAAVVAFSGRLASAVKPPSADTATPILIVHGELDPVIPVAHAIEAADRLERAGFPVKRLIVPQLRHSISAPAADAALEFLGTAG